ncbi:GNAT family acetyltransferase, putative [Talaromyces stipitatus ATCC 10500]|uniref:GNAT family acetyltransferase, putative n=1 Tax=Talaromyces stipitatus (strain ATCC 10500 / CBS 375.48 / QM 6759 / NRRL 1006) TaxID=441959 RepID=B8M0P4_TALSN|nr:GNAT family acetyltransferase, putative [Talaromyces stipitatus ATCC 10500]EED21427.1 GNAT family acetyltransferase, putative [Talaromyces stipitatus ATCC 10500]
MTINRPLGFPVPDPTPAPRPSRVILQGRTVTLEPLQASHAEELFPHVGGAAVGWLWDYMLGGPVADVEELRTQFGIWEKSEDPVIWAIRVPTKKSTSTQVVGYIGFLDIAHVHRTIEVGHVMYSLALQRTTAATETFYLLARYAFRDLGYRRLSWKCNNLNESSKKAALRYGFLYEGLFRQHLIIKGRNRDTAWFSMLDSEWSGDGGFEAGYQRWLDERNFDEQGKQERRLEEFVVRKPVQKEKG